MAALPNDEEVVIRIENPVDEDVIETSTDTVELATEQLTPTKQPPLDADLIRQLMEKIANLEVQVNSNQRSSTGTRFSHKR